MGLLLVSIELLLLNFVIENILGSANKQTLLRNWLWLGERRSELMGRVDHRLPSHARHPVIVSLTKEARIRHWEVICGLGLQLLHCIQGGSLLLRHKTLRRVKTLILVDLVEQGLTILHSFEFLLILDRLHVHQLNKVLLIFLHQPRFFKQDSSLLLELRCSRLRAKCYSVFILLWFFWFFFDYFRLSRVRVVLKRAISGVVVS